MLDASITTYFINKIESLPSGLVYTVVAILVFGEAAVFLGFIFPGETSVIVVGYFVGDEWGERILRTRPFRNRQDDLNRAIEGLRKRGPIYVFAARFTAFLRAVMPGLAGMSRMQYRRFLLANASGALLWGVGYSLLGYFAGSELTRIEHYSNWFAIGVLVILVAVIVTIYLRRRQRDLRAKNETTS
jgi:membrane protein DedA with SNARE-associated domain